MQAQPNHKPTIVFTDERAGYTDIDVENEEDQGKLWNQGRRNESKKNLTDYQ